MSVSPQSHRSSHFPLTTSRRDWLCQAGGGFGAIALAGLLSEQSAGSGRALGSTPAEDLQAPRAAHFQPRAKRVIYLFMHGGPSHVDLFDPKPDLTRLCRAAVARELRPGDDAPQGGDRIRCWLRSSQFRPRGQIGTGDQRLSSPIWPAWPTNFACCAVATATASIIRSRSIR